MTCCNASFSRDEGYIKSEIFDFTVQEEIAIGTVIPIFRLAANNMIRSLFLEGATAGMGTLSVGLYTDNGMMLPIIPKFFKNKAIAAPTPPAIVAKTDFYELSPDVKPTGLATNPAINSLKDVVNAILDDSSYVVPADFDRNDINYRNPNTYVLGVTSSAKLAVDTRAVFLLDYMGTV